MRILRASIIFLALGGLLQMAAVVVVAARPTSPVVAKLNVAGVAAGNQRGSRSSSKRIAITGKLTGEGVECQAFRSKNGILYTLVGNLRGFREGDKVRIVGKVVKISTCMQGTTLALESIRKVGRSD